MVNLEAAPVFAPPTKPEVTRCGSSARVDTGTFLPNEVQVPS